MSPDPAAAASSPRPDAAVLAGVTYEEALWSRGGPIRRWFARHPWAMDTFVAAWFTVPSIAAGVLTQPRAPISYWVMVLLTTTALMFRRRRPVQGLLVIALTTTVSSMAFGTSNGHEFALALAVYAVASLRPPKIAWACTALAIAAVAIPTMLFADWETLNVEVDADVPLTPRLALTIAVAWLALFILIGHAIGTSVRGRREHIRALVEATAAAVFERDQRHQLAAVAERARISREMHDIVAHSVSVMVALADGAQASLDRDPEASRRALTEMSSTGREALSQMRHIVGVLREDDDGTEGLSPLSGDLDELYERFRAAGLPLRTVHQGPVLPDRPGIRLTVFRVVQEALTNVLRHARHTSSVVVTTRHERHRVVIDIRNTADPTAGHGQPHGPTAGQLGAGRGLIGMRERVAAHGGSVTTGPVPGGWSVRATLELAADDHDPVQETASEDGTRQESMEMNR